MLHTCINQSSRLHKGYYLKGMVPSIKVNSTKMYKISSSHSTPFLSPSSEITPLLSFIKPSTNEFCLTHLLLLHSFSLYKWIFFPVFVECPSHVYAINIIFYPSCNYYSNFVKSKSFKLTVEINPNVHVKNC